MLGPADDGDHGADSGRHASQDQAPAAAALCDVYERPDAGDVAELETAHIDVKVSIARDRVGQSVDTSYPCLKLMRQGRGHRLRVEVVGRSPGPSGRPGPSAPWVPRPRRPHRA